MRMTRNQVAGWAFTGIVLASIILGWPARESGPLAPPPPGPATGAEPNFAPVPANWTGRLPATGCAPTYISFQTAARETVLTAVSAVSADDMWAVGYARTDNRSRTLILHWDGAAWRQVPSPNHGTEVNVLYGVTALAADNVWAVGTAGETALATLILHWDGRQWTIVSSPNIGTTNNILRGVAGTGAADLWAVGSVNTGEAAFDALILHWDGTAWHLISAPDAGLGRQGEFDILHAVAAVAPDDAWAVGRTTAGMWILHWDGHDWRESAPPPLKLMNTLYAVSAANSHDVWAAGEVESISGGQAGATLHWDGHAWRRVPVPYPDQIAYGLRGISVQAGQSAWAVGDVEGDQPWFTQWRDNYWSIPASGSATTQTYRNLRAVTVAPGGIVWAVGADHQADIPAPVGSLEGPGTGAALIGRLAGVDCAATPNPAHPDAHLIVDMIRQVAVGGGRLVWSELNTGDTLWTYDAISGQVVPFMQGGGEYGELHAADQGVAWRAGSQIWYAAFADRQARPLLTIPESRQLPINQAFAVNSNTVYYATDYPYQQADLANHPDAEVTATPQPDEGTLFAWDTRSSRESLVAHPGAAPVAGDGVLLWLGADGIHVRRLAGTGSDRVIPGSETLTGPYSDPGQYVVAGSYVAWLRGQTTQELHLYNVEQGTDRELASGPISAIAARGDWVVWVAGNEPYTVPHPWTIRGYRISTGTIVTLAAGQGVQDVRWVGLIDPAILLYGKGSALYSLPLPGP